MSEGEAVKAPPMWKSYLVGLFLFSMVLGPALGMLFYFYRQFSIRMGWYVGTSLVFGFALGVGLSAVAAAIFAKRASG